MCFLQLGLQSSDLLPLTLLLLHSQHLVLMLQPDELFSEQSHIQSQCSYTTVKLKVNNFYMVRSSVYYLYSMGISSAARLSWLGLPEGRIPTWKKVLFASEYQSDSNGNIVRYDYPVTYLLWRAGAVEPECNAAPRWSLSENLSQWSSSIGGEGVLKQQTKC